MLYMCICLIIKMLINRFNQYVKTGLEVLVAGTLEARAGRNVQLDARTGGEGWKRGLEARAGGKG